MVTVAKSFEAPIKRKQLVLETIAENPHHVLSCLELFTVVIANAAK